jgi:hypothetical protein
MFFMIPLGNDLAEQFRDCLRLLNRLAAAAGAAEAGIAAHSKHNVRGSAIEDVLGGRDTERLLRGSVAISDIRLHLITERAAGQLQRGPLVAAYVSPWFVEKLVAESRFTDVIYLPWTPKDEAAFFHQHAPQVLSAPEGWVPPAEEPPTDAGTDSPREEAGGIRESLTSEERVLPLEHTIDPGFVNCRRIGTLIGPEGLDAIDRVISRLPPMPKGLRAVRIGRIYSDVMLKFCRELKVPPLGSSSRKSEAELLQKSGAVFSVRRRPSVPAGTSAKSNAR